MSFKKILVSPKTIISLIIVTIIACLSGVFIPQVTDRSPSYFEAWERESPYLFALVDSLRLSSVFTSLWFFILIFFVLITLAYSIYIQIKRNIKDKDSWVAVHGSQHVEERIKTVFERKGFRLLTVHGKEKVSDEVTAQNDEQVFVFVKNSIGRWGSVVFHCGMLIVIISAIITFSFQKRGFIQITEGTVFSGMDSDFDVKDPGLFVKRFNTGFKTHLSGLHHTYLDSGGIESLESSVIIDRGNRRTEQVVSINSPLNIDGVKVYQSWDYGYALSFLFIRSTGEQFMINYLFDRPDKAKMPFVLTSDIPATDYMIDMKFYPDFSGTSFNLSRPSLKLHVNEKGTEVFRGLLIPGQAVKIKDDIMQLMSIRNWSGLIFARDIGTGMAFTGFAFALCGVLIIYLLPYKKIQLTRHGDSILSIKGIAKRYRAIFEEEVNSIRTELGVKAKN